MLLRDLYSKLPSIFKGGICYNEYRLSESMEYGGYIFNILDTSDKECLRLRARLVGGVLRGSLKKTLYDRVMKFYNAVIEAGSNCGVAYGEGYYRIHITRYYVGLIDDLTDFYGYRLTIFDEIDNGRLYTVGIDLNEALSFKIYHFTERSLHKNAHRIIDNIDECHIRYVLEMKDYDIRSGQVQREKIYFRMKDLEYSNDLFPNFEIGASSLKLLIGNHGKWRINYCAYDHKLLKNQLYVVHKLS